MAGTGWSKFQNIFYMENGLNASQIGLLKSIGLILKFFGEPILCMVADLTDQKMVFATCIVMQMLSMEGLRWIAISFESVLFVKVMRTTTAPSSTFTTTASFALTEGTKEGYGKQRMFGSLAWGGGSLLAGVLIDRFGMQAIFWFSHFFNAACFLLVVICVPSALLLKHRRHPSEGSDKPVGDGDPGASALPALPAGAAPGAGAAPRPPSAWAIYLRKYAADARRFLQSGPCRAVLASALVYGFVMTVPDTYLFLSLEKDFRASRTLSGLCTLVSTSSCIPFFWYSDPLLRRHGHHRVMLAAQATCVLRLLLLALLPPAWPLSLPLIVAAQLAHGANFALFWAAAVDALRRLAPAGLAASSLAALNMSYFTLAGVAAGVVWGPLYDARGAAAVYLGAAAVLALNVARCAGGAGALLGAALAPAPGPSDARRDGERGEGAGGRE
jgi:predicted MFS family arabinose efflux permease